MRCRELLNGFEWECTRGNVEREIKEVVYDSRKLKPGCMFICICGYKTVGQQFSGEAAVAGAAALVGP